jgi:hypothetical protein
VLTPTHVPQKNAAWGIAAAPEVGEVGKRMG